MADEQVIKFQSKIILFSYAGKTMIGQIWHQGALESGFYSSNTIIGCMIGSSMGQVTDEHYAISNPCEIQFVIQKPTTGSAKLNWKLKPYFFKKLIKTTVQDVKFAFPKTQVCLSNIEQTQMDDKLIKAYKELIKVN